jgi:hypothetical protein
MIIVDTLSPHLDLLAAGVGGRVTTAMEEGAREIEAYAQQNAPWTDRTGEARNGLTATVSEDNGEIVITLAHSVEYGIYLELKNDGEYAIIMPTLEAVGPEVIRAAGGRVVSIGGVF